MTSNGRGCGSWHSCWNMRTWVSLVAKVWSVKLWEKIKQKKNQATSLSELFRILSLLVARKSGTHAPDHHHSLRTLKPYMVVDLNITKWECSATLLLTRHILPPGFTSEFRSAMTNTSFTMPSRMPCRLLPLTFVVLIVHAIGKKERVCNNTGVGNMYYDPNVQDMVTCPILLSHCAFVGMPQARENCARCCGQTGTTAETSTGKIWNYFS